MVLFNSTKKLYPVSLFFVVILLFAVSSIQATFIPPQGTSLVEIEVSAGDDMGSMSWLFPPGMAIQDKHEWRLPQQAIINSKANPQKPLLTIDLLDVEYIADPLVALNFVVTAGSADTTVSITSAMLSFPALVNPVGYATAAVTVTDNNLNGATISGLQTGTKIYEARYNGSVAWANLIDPVSADPGSSGVGEERRPTLPTVWETIPATMSSMQSEFKFTLTAGDSASGTSAFEVVPEPATLALLSVAGLALLRRRRK